MKPNFTRFVNM